ncbi:MAG: metallophosphoesterase, partial [Bacteroidota bacterium]
NLAKVIEFNKKMGFQILLNESVKMNIDGEEIAIIGVENWGTPPFPQYGDLKKAMNGVEDVPFKILLSHDPSHWGAEVLNTTNIDITLSGHTHGMQFGVEIGSIKWSPVQMRYPRWGGLYTEGKQHLYVNRGFGFIGFPGRVGMPPEITFIELEKT